jgi:DNA-binding CsgD family transcriptional regulator
MIAPRINPALFAHSLIGEDGTLTELLGSMIAHAGYGLVLANEDRKIIYANDAAKALMRASQGLRCSNDCISATDFNSSQQLQSLIFAATWQTGEPIQGGSMFLRDEDGVATLVIHVVPLSRRSAEFSPYGSTPFAGLLIFDCKRGISDRVKVFSELFALTSAEMRVLSQLLSGGGVTHAASQLNIAQSTAQTHLKRILEKAGTHRQAELVRVFYEITFPWYGRGGMKSGRFAPWQAACFSAAADDAGAPRRNETVK